MRSMVSSREEQSILCASMLSDDHGFPSEWYRLTYTQTDVAQEAIKMLFDRHDSVLSFVW